MLFISTSGVLGRYITLPPPISILIRSLIALFFISLFAIYKRYTFKINYKKHGLAILLSGFFMALHWITYFFSLQWSNIAIGMMTLFTYPLITVFLEPLFMNVKLQKRHFILGLMVIFGIYFLVSEFNIDNSKTRGLLIGLLSALAYSLRNLILKKHNAMGNGSIQMIYQLGIIIILLFPSFWLYPGVNITSQWPYLLILGLITTSLGHTLFLNSFSHFSLSSASIMSSIQPIFGILLGSIFLYEIPNIKSIFGGILILMTVLIENIYTKNSQL